MLKILWQCRSMIYERMLITDLDGTVKAKDQPLSVSNQVALKNLNSSNCLRVVATGRSLWSAKQVIPADTALDYLVFSCGAGILNWVTGDLLVRHHIAADEVAHTYQLLNKFRLDFMIHDPIPKNHYFKYFSAEGNPDFKRRCERNASFAARGTGEEISQTASQFVVVVPELTGRAMFEKVSHALPRLNVVRTTSPLDHRSVWIEILPQRASKSTAGQWLADRYQLATHQIFALGNDYNDQDLLAWAGSSFLMKDGPNDLKQLFPLLHSAEENSIAEATRIWGF
jgi:HAD superfamily hydrolase (TIGR01484 family)